MVPLDKVKDIIAKHDALEKELSSGNIDPKLYAKKSKEYSNLGNVIQIAKEYVNFENDKRDMSRRQKRLHLMKPNYNHNQLIDLVF